MGTEDDSVGQCVQSLFWYQLPQFLLDKGRKTGVFIDLVYFQLVNDADLTHSAKNAKNANKLICSLC